MSESEGLNAQYLQGLVAARSPETEDLEFKRELPDGKDSERNEFLKDVCGMANAGGGLILYGIDEHKEGGAAGICALTEPFDKAQLLLRNYLDSMVEPRLASLRFERIDVDGGYVMALHVPDDFGGPFWCGQHGGRRFPIRRGPKVDYYTYHELRAAFDRSGTAIARAGEWIANRQALIQKGSLWRGLEVAPWVAVQVVPLGPYARSQQPIDLALARKNLDWFRGDEWPGYSHSMNFDGLVVFPQTAGRLVAYSQLFRGGAQERALSLKRRAAFTDSRYASILPSEKLATHVRNSIDDAGKSMLSLGLRGSALIAVSLHGVGAYTLSLAPGAVDRDSIEVPPIFVEDIAGIPGEDQFAANAMEVIWQSYGANSCPYFASDGTWDPKGAEARA